MEDKGLIALFDVDSLIYKAMYRIVTIADIRQKLEEIDKEGNIRKQKSDIREWILEVAFARLELQVCNILTESEHYGIQIDKIEYYITYCLRSVRKEISTTYKAQRMGKGTPDTGIRLGIWSSKLRAYIAERSGFNVKFSLLWEADDLIANRAKELRKKGGQDYIVYTIDKDLKQIPGHHFNYYLAKVKRDYRESIPEVVYRSNHWAYQRKFFVETIDGVTHLFDFAKEFVGYFTMNQTESTNFLLTQMIWGDTADNIQGLPRQGEAFTKKNFTESPWHNAKAVIRGYKKYYGEENYREPMKTTFRLLKIGN